MSDENNIENGEADLDIELVTCVLGGVEFGLDIKSVQEIVRLPKITPVPRAPEYVQGVANLRGNLLPIINSRSRFGLPESEASNNRVVVVELNGQPTGMIVDSVREVMHVARKDVEEAPAAVQSINGRFLKGIVKLEGGNRLVLLLDQNAILEAATRTVETVGEMVNDMAIANTAIESITEESEQLVTFRIGEEEYGIPIRDVQEIIRVPSINAVPNAPAGVIGIASLRNRILPVVDLRTKFGFSPLKDELETVCITARGYERRHNEAIDNLIHVLEEGGIFERNHLRTYREFDRWQETCAGADRLLRSLMNPVRDAMRDIAIELRSMSSNVEASSNDDYRKHSILKLRSDQAHISALFEKFYTGIAKRDDERCLVLSINGAWIALRVDAVNQVLQVARDSVEETPGIVAGDGQEKAQLRGIAKLDDGKRLIMLLNMENLITNAEIRNMEKLTTGRGDGDERGRSLAGGESDERQLVTFKVADEEFAIDIMRVQEIIRLEKVTKVPRVPSFVEGVVNLRGNVLPVIDLRKRVNLEPKNYSDATRVVVMDVSGLKTGIIVDSVSEVLRVHSRNLEPTPSIVRSRYGDNIIEGVGKLNKGERMFLLLRAEELLCSEA